MITCTQGNLLEANVEALVNTVNTMGKGIALMFKERFPANMEAYARACEAGDVQTGKIFVTETGELMGPHWIVNFPTRQHWRAKSQMPWLTCAASLKAPARDGGSAGSAGAITGKKRDRRGEFLFIDARQLGYMKDRVLRDFTLKDIQKIADTFHAWQQGEGYADVPGFCYSAKLDDVRKHEHVLTPGRYVGAVKQEEDGEPFAEKMQRLTMQLAEQFAESAKLEAEIKKNLAGLGYEL